jgi:DNA repair protein RAD50
MANIEKLAIRGVRSFHPDREETIEFYSPLTMIVGANGCGKTSIIESLKYACTGAMPPSCSNGIYI